jgi:hypothetical protein
LRECDKIDPQGGDEENDRLVQLEEGEHRRVQADQPIARGAEFPLGREFNEIDT